MAKSGETRDDDSDTEIPLDRDILNFAVAVQDERNAPVEAPHDCAVPSTSAEGTEADLDTTSALQRIQEKVTNQRKRVKVCII